jgi:hypothetical protein
MLLFVAMSVAFLTMSVAFVVLNMMVLLWWVDWDMDWVWNLLVDWEFHFLVDDMGSVDWNLKI